jgi:hypothetical protein
VRAEDVAAAAEPNVLMRRWRDEYDMPICFRLRAFAVAPRQDGKKRTAQLILG